MSYAAFGAVNVLGICEQHLVVCSCALASVFLSVKLRGSLEKHGFGSVIKN